MRTNTIFEARKKEEIKTNMRSSKAITIKIVNGENIPTKEVNTKNKKVLLLSLANNIEDKYINSIKEFFGQLEQKFKSVKLGIFTNNNTDNSVEILNSWASTTNNILIKVGPDEKLVVYEKNKCGNRIPKLAEYRNLIFHESIQFFGDDFDYIIVFDSDMREVYDIDQIIRSISVTTQWSAISSNNCFYKSNYHYDVLALRLDDHPINISQTYKNFQNFYGRTPDWIDQLYIFTNFVKVKSGFGGLTIYNGKELIDIYKNNNLLYNVSDLPDGTCEHISLDVKLKNPHYINSDLYISNHNTLNKINLEEHLYHAPSVMIPRDAGFFSVFNFLFGHICTGARIYPYFNKEEFLKFRKINQHFSYWTNSDNTWLDFFNPISYYKNDTEHTNKEFLKYSYSGGESGAKEFKIPADSKNLLQNSETTFKSWRYHHNSIYKQYISLKPAIEEKINKTFLSMFRPKDFVIGVHYRHPSHFIESGAILLDSYFEQIDKVLQEVPEAKIFIASDNDFGIAAFEKQYANKIKYITNIKRTSMNNILEWFFAIINKGRPDKVGFIKNKGYELHHTSSKDENNYQMTEDLLLEVMCLSKCQKFIGSTSNISLAISYINPDIEMTIL